MNSLLSAMTRYFRRRHTASVRTPTEDRKARRIRLHVETLEDRSLPSAYMVTTTADSGPGSLRDAINQVNADTSHVLYASPSNAAVDEIDFAVTAASDTGGGYNATTGVATITPQSGLPIITNAVTIDGWTQPRFRQAPPLIEIPIRRSGAATDLVVMAGHTTLRGLVVDSFGGNGVDLSGAAGDVLQGNYIGTDPSGLHKNGNGNFDIYS